MSPRRESLVVALAGAALLVACGAPRPADTVALTHEWDLASTCKEITLSAQRDVGDRPFLYVAAKEGGLKVYDVSGEPALVATVGIDALHGLQVMNFSQQGTTLALALGNTFGTAVQAPGLALVDVSDPKRPAVRGLWFDDAVTSGTGIAVLDGTRVFLGAMGQGLIVFDATDAANPRERSRFVPPLDFPDAKFDAAKINARGLAVVGDTVYLCDDAGGFRVIDVSDAAHPSELGRWSNPAMNGKPRAYNNVVLDGTTAYLGFDYCGVEVVDVANPADIKPVGWWNPWRCERGGLSWFSSDGWANEVALDREQRLLFVSAGKSDLEVLDVSDPASPTRAAELGGVDHDNGIGSWGVSRHGTELFVTYTCAVVPFSSSWTGVKAFTYRRR